MYGQNFADGHACNYSFSNQNTDKWVIFIQRKNPTSKEKFAFSKLSKNT